MAMWEKAAATRKRGAKALRHAALRYTNQPGIVPAGARDHRVVALRIAVGHRPRGEVGGQCLDGRARRESDGGDGQVAARVSELRLNGQ